MLTTTETFAEERFAGNWERRDCFVWSEKPEHADDYGLWVLSHRDSGLIDQSSAIIRKRLEKFEAAGDVIFFGCSHSLVGTTNELAVRDEQGAFPSADSIGCALVALGIIAGEQTEGSN